MSRTAASARSAWIRRREDLWRQSLAPPPQLTLSEWADENRMIVAPAPEPGPWRTDRAPYLREIQDTMTDPDVERVVWMAASQVGKTEVEINLCCYYIDVDPAAILVVLPTKDFAEDFSSERLGPTLRAMKSTRGKVRDEQGKGSNSKIRRKLFPGGVLVLVGANSATDLSSRPIRVVVADEVDRYSESAAGEGDPLTMATQRTANYEGQKKLLFISTPKLKGSSRIEEEFDLSDQRRYFVPCPHCEHMQTLRWKDHLVWDKDVDDDGTTLQHHPETAQYACEECGSTIDESHKRWMLENGEWRATNPDGRFPGFHINALYSLWRSWAKLVELWLEAQGDKEKLQAFINLQLGESWEERNEEVDHRTLEGRAEAYSAEVPRGVAVLTAAVDVQGDRLEVAVWGWGPRQEVWLTTHERIHGDPEKKEVWSRLENILASPYEHELGVQMRIRAAMIDSSYRPDLVYPFVRPREGRGVYAVQGMDGRAKDHIKRSTRKNEAGVKLWTIRTWSYKDTLFRRLPIQTPGLPGYIHFCEPTTTGADAEFFAQFEAEVAEKKNGRTVGYKQIRQRNEAIDLYVYGLAALHTLGPAIYDHLDRQLEKLKKAAEKKQDDDDDDDKQKPKVPSTKQKRRRPPRGGGFVKNY